MIGCKSSIVFNSFAKQLNLTGGSYVPSVTKRENNCMGAMQVVRTIMRSKMAQLFFNRPVDPDMLGIPEYRQIVTVRNLVACWFNLLLVTDTLGFVSTGCCQPIGKRALEFVQLCPGSISTLNIIVVI